MSLKNWIALLFLYILYLCLGGLLFNLLECPLELEAKKSETQKLAKTNSVASALEKGLEPDQIILLEQLLENIAPYDVNMMSSKSNETEECHKWDFFNSLFFSFTVVTTIGYGHQAPESNNGRLVCMFYALIGVPLNAILIGAMANVFSRKVTSLKSSAKEGLGIPGLDGTGKVGKVIFEGFIGFVVFTSLFIFVPAALFSYGGLEPDDWEYVDSVYFAFITLTTIGFGDMVAGRNLEEVDASHGVKVFYRVVIIIWIIFGMGYIIGVINIISESLQSSSKPVKRAIRGIKNQIQTQDYWRKILHEIIANKQNEGQMWASDGLLDIVEGGSQPCLREVDETGDRYEKSASAGDIRSEARKSPLSELDACSLQTIDHDNIGFLHDIEEINEETVTSIRNFLTSATIDAKDGGNSAAIANWMENNMPELGPGQPSDLSHDSYARTIGAAALLAVPGQSQEKDRRRSLQVPARTLVRRNSTHSGNSFKSAASGGPVSLLLEHTTLGEFLSAVEAVRAKSAEETRPRDESLEESRSHGNTIIRKLSNIRKPKIRKESTYSLNQLSAILSAQTHSAETDRERKTSDKTASRKSSSKSELNNFGTN